MAKQLEVRNLLLVSKVMLNEEEVIVEDGEAAGSEQSVVGYQGNVK